MITLPLDHPLILACKELFPDRLQYAWPAELRITESGFSIRATLPAHMHFGKVQADMVASRASFCDYDAYDGNEDLMESVELTAQQVDELKELLQAATQ